MKERGKNPGPKRSVNVGNRVFVSAPENRYYMHEGTVVEYIPTTPTSWSPYIRVLFDDGTTRRFRPAEVRVLQEQRLSHLFDVEPDRVFTTKLTGNIIQELRKESLWINEE